MKTLKIITLSITLLISATNLVSAQKSNYTKIKSYLEKEEIKFRTTENNNFSVTFDMGKERSQSVYIMSEPDIYDGIEMLEVVSASFSIENKSQLTDQQLIDLLTENSILKIGFWHLSRISEDFVFLYSIKLPFNSLNRSDLVKFLILAAEVADDKEQELSEDDKF